MLYDLGEKIKDTREYEQLLEAIKRFYDTNQYWPTQLEIANVLGWGERKVCHKLKTLERGKYVYKVDGCIRNVRLSF